MSEISRVNPMGAQITAPRPALPEAQAVTQSRSDPAIGTQPRALSQTDPHFTKPRPDADMPTGPSPAFQASLLEIQSDLQNVIKRLEAARELARDAVAPGPVPGQPAADNAAQNDSAARNRDAQQDNPYGDTDLTR